MVRNVRAFHLLNIKKQRKITKQSNQERKACAEEEQAVKTSSNRLCDHFQFFCFCFAGFLFGDVVVQPVSELCSCSEFPVYLYISSYQCKFRKSDYLFFSGEGLFDKQPTRSSVKVFSSGKELKGKSRDASSCFSLSIIYFSRSQVS